MYMMEKETRLVTGGVPGLSSPQQANKVVCATRCAFSRGTFSQDFTKELPLHFRLDREAQIALQKRYQHSSCPNTQAMLCRRENLSRCTPSFK